MLLRAVTLLFVCQLAGEALVQAMGLAFPGPVIGMGLRLALLLLRGKSWPGRDSVTDTLRRNLSLLFVPAAVGVMQQAAHLAAQWLVIAVAVGASTVLTLVVTVLTFRALVRLQARRRALWKPVSSRSGSISPRHRCCG